MQDLLNKLRNKPFYIWATLKHRDTTGYENKTCCFNHIIGLPTKNGVPQQLWDYEDMIYRALMIPGYVNSIPNKGPSAYSMEEKKKRDLDQKGASSFL